MKIEVHFCNFDEISLGLFMANGEDENGQFHMVTFGFLVFEINFLKYS